MFRFIDRGHELRFLEERFKEKGKQLLIIYGRRRVGKTELVKQFLRGKEFIYFLADKRGTRLNAERFAGIAAEHFKDIAPRVENFDDVFKYILKRREGGVVVIDEFSYLVERDDAVPSVFQLIWDEVVGEKKLVLILVGSLVSMMEKGALSSKSPLYGRRTGQWRVKTLSFEEARKFHHLPIEESVLVYSVTGGVPMYLRAFEEEKNVFSNIRDKIVIKGSPLYEETEFLLREELRDYSSYLSILEALGAGNTRVTEIANYSKMQAKDLPKYLNTLIRLDLIKKELPVTAKRKSRKTMYRLTDNFFRFWFKFVHPNKSDIEIGNHARVMEIVERDFNTFVGAAFEEMAVGFLWELQRKKALPLSFSKLGRWWDKGEEIDIVALNDATKEIAFFEVKWSALSKGDADRILRELKRKAGLVRWHNRTRSEEYGVIAKEIEDKEALKSEGYHVYDLADFEL